MVADNLKFKPPPNPHRRPRDDSDSFAVGDLVTRDGSDLHLVMYLTEDGFSGDFLCVRAPAGSWTSFGVAEHNLARRYSFVCSLASLGLAGCRAIDKRRRLRPGLLTAEFGAELTTGEGSENTTRQIPQRPGIPPTRGHA